MTRGQRDRREPSAGDSTQPLDGDRAALGLLLVGAGVEVEVALPGTAVLTIGRAHDNDVVVPHPSVSRRHARLHTGDALVLEALATTNPVRFGGRELAPGERVAIAPGEAFAIGAIVGAIRPRPPAPPTEPSPPRRALRHVLADEERRRIVDALRRSAGNQSRAAELLGMPRRTLVKRLRDYGIPRGRVVPDADP